MLHRRLLLYGWLLVDWLLLGHWYLWLRSWLGLLLGYLRGHRDTLLSHLVDDRVRYFRAEHVNDCVQRLLLLQVELFLVVLDDHREEVLIVVLHALALEVVVLELTLILDDCTAKAVEIKYALLLAGLSHRPTIAIIHCL